MIDMSSRRLMMHLGEWQITNTRTIVTRIIAMMIFLSKRHILHLVFDCIKEVSQVLVDIAGIVTVSSNGSFNTVIEANKNV
jgi:hypothetical protein